MEHGELDDAEEPDEVSHLAQSNGVHLSGREGHLSRQGV